MNHLKYLLGTGFYTGLSPFAPGTVGSLAALLVIYGFVSYHYVILIPVFVLISCVITIWVSTHFEELYGKDPVTLVMDEWAGMGMTFLLLMLFDDLNLHFMLFISSFILFRIFDIFKPFGIHSVQKLSNGWGILFDDLLSGFYAFLCLKTLIFIWPEIIG